MKTLITGITGLLGTALVEKNKGKVAIKGIYIGDYEIPDTENIEYVVCDVTLKEELFNKFKDDDIDYIIHTAGIANTDVCENQPERAEVSNITGTRNIIELAKLKGAKLVYISTNAVFDGTAAPYSEEDRTGPINQYGRLKLKCEEMIRSAFSSEQLIIRPVLMYGLNNPNERKSFFMWIMEKLQSGQSISMVNDIYENPLLSNQCADIIWKLIGKGATGIYHVAGRDVLNRYEAANLVAKEFQLDDTLINSVSSDFFPNIAPRPKNTSYKTEKIEKELGVKPIGFEEGLRFLKSRMVITRK